jgi:hypothetical protein
MRPPNVRQQVAWISGETPQRFIDNVNTATTLGYELFSTHKVEGKFMGALLVKWVDMEEEISEALKEPAKVLRLVRDEEEADSGGAGSGVSGGGGGVSEDTGDGGAPS